MANIPDRNQLISAFNAGEKIRACGNPKAARADVIAAIRRGALTVTGFPTFYYDLAGNSAEKGVSVQKDPMKLNHTWWSRIEKDHQATSFWKVGTVNLTKTSKDAQAEITGIMIDEVGLDEILAPHAALPPTPAAGKSRKGANAYRHGEPITYVVLCLNKLPANQRNKMTAKAVSDLLDATYTAMGYNSPNERNLVGIASGILSALKTPAKLDEMIQDTGIIRQSEARSRR